MAYLGNQPAESYASFERQVFTIVNSQTAYTLTHAVTNENDIRLVINSVVQEPGSGKAYTASNTTLTLSAALVNGTDEMYCVYLGRALQTVNPPNASVGTSQLASSLDLSSKTITLASNMKNTPSFFAYLSSSQSVSDGVYTKIQFDTELLDTDNAYDNSTNYRFTPQTAGNYFISVNTMSDYSNTVNIQDTVIYKNGDKFLRSYVDNRGQNTYNQSTNISGIVSFNGSSDYIEGFTRLNVGSGTPSLSASSSSPLQHYTYMYGYKIIE